MAGAILVLTTRGAAAEPARAAEAERARALYEEAGELEREGSWPAAQERLRAALKLRETPHLHYALGWALENGDRLVEAKAEYEVAVRLARREPGAAEAARLATARLAVLEKNVPSVRVRVGKAARSNARIVVDGREQRREGEVAVAIVDPGSHAVRVERDGERTVERIVYVGRGGTAWVVVGVEPSPPASRLAPPPRSPAPQPRLAVSTVPPPKTSPPADHDPVPWILLTSGIAALTAGSALFVTADSSTHGFGVGEMAGLTIGALGVAASTAAALLLVPRSEKPVAPRASIGPALRF